jgi:hypothetical protein
MSDAELVARYLSDVRAARTAYENGILDRIEFDASVQRLDSMLFDTLDMTAIVTPTAELERILAYSVE